MTARRHSQVSAGRALRLMVSRRGRFGLKFAVSTSVACWAMAVAAAPPSVPWTPGTASRSALELLVDRAGLDLPVMQWPLPRSAVIDALDALPADLPEALARARDVVRADLRRQESALLDVTARPRADTLAGYGDDATPGSSAELRTGIQQSTHYALQAGGRVETMSTPGRPGAELRLDDSAAVVGGFGVQLQAWSHRSWWGPGWQNALALSNNAPALDAVGIQRSSASTSRSPWLSWLGPWSGEAFIARSERYADPARPLILGGRLEARPFSHLELGVEYTAQWGGAGRRESLGSFLDMILGRHVNADTVQEQAADPGNGLAGYDARLRCPDVLRCAFYGQAIGEDMAGGLPSRFLAMGGAEVWSADGSQRLFVEDARTSAYRAWFGPPLVDYAYRNYAYRDGYTDDRRWLGANAGPDSRIATLGWIDMGADSVVRLSVGHVGSRIGSYSAETFDPATSGRLRSLSARRSLDWLGARWTPQFDWDRLHAPSGLHREARASLEVSLPIDELIHGR